MHVHRTRLAVAAIAAALMLTSIASVASAFDRRGPDVAAPVTPSGDPGGSTTGAVCLLEAAASDEVYRTTGATVVPLEDVLIFGSGYAPNGEGLLEADNLDSGEHVEFDAAFESDGTYFEAFYFVVGGEGTWRETLSQASPSCSDQIDIEVLPLRDILESKFLQDIKWLFVEDITFGCTSTTFCPDGLVTRGQMATFLSRALNLPATSTDYFRDDETNKHEANINRLRAADITFGCTSTAFCPDGLVTRGQMASFLVRAFHLPATSADYFRDDETNKHEANINRLRASNITFGCGGTNLLPERLGDAWPDGGVPASGRRLTYAPAPTMTIGSVASRRSAALRRGVRRPVLGPVVRAGIGDQQRGARDRPSQRRQRRGR